MTAYNLPAESSTKLQPFTDYDAAAKFLDDTFPDWHTKINLDKLDMANWSRCILGQLRPHVSVNGKKLEHTIELVRYFFGKSDTCMGASSVFACRFVGHSTYDHTKKWKEMVKARYGTALELELRAAKLKVQELERKVLEEKKAEERRRKPVTLTLTQDEVQLLLERKPGAVREKIQKQIADQLQ